MSPSTSLNQICFQSPLKSDSSQCALCLLELSSRSADLNGLHEADHVDWSVIEENPNSKHNCTQILFEKCFYCRSFFFSLALSFFRSNISLCVNCHKWRREMHKGDRMFDLWILWWWISWTGYFLSFEGKLDAVCDTNASQSNKTFLCGNTRQQTYLKTC